MIIDWSKYDEDKAEEIANRFGKATLEQMTKNLTSFGLVRSGTLLQSLKFKVKKDAHIVDRVEFIYEFYGRFHNSGAKQIFGRNQDLPIKPWRTVAFEQTVPQMLDDMSELMAQAIADEIVVDSVKLQF